MLSNSLAAPAAEPSAGRQSKASGSRVTGNLIVLGAPRTEGNDDVAGSPHSVVGIDVAAEATLVEANFVSFGLVEGGVQRTAYGITVWAGAVRIVHNTLLHAGGEGEIEPGTFGVALWPSEQGTQGTVIAGNTIHGLAVGISLEPTKPNASASPVRNTTIADNSILQAADAAILGHGLQGRSIARNRIRFAAFAEAEQPREFHAAVELSTDETDSDAEIVVDGCLVEESGRRPTGVPDPEQRVVGVWLRAARMAVQNNCIGTRQLSQESEDTDRKIEHRALVLVGASSPAADSPVGKALVSGNQFRGTGLSALVEIQDVIPPLPGDRRRAFARVNFSGNEVEHRSLSGTQGGRASVSLAGGARERGGLVVANNHVSGEGEFASFNLHNVRATFTGNVMTGVPVGVAGVRPMPAESFNWVGSDSS